MREQNNYGKLARDIAAICRHAQAKQQAFMAHRGLTIETLRGMSASERAELDKAYKTFEYVPWRPWFA